MTAPVLSPATRKDLKSQAHDLSPVVIIGDAGLTPPVLKEIDRALTAHGLIKVRVAGDDREARIGIYDSICDQLGAAPVQHIGKLLVLWRAVPVADILAEKLRPTGSKSVARKTAERKSALRKNPVTGRLIGPRGISTSTRKTPEGQRPPRSARVRASGQRSAKKAFQDR